MRLFIHYLVLIALTRFIAQAAEPLPLRTDFWKNESFLRSFNGSYLPNARIEPTLSSAERALLVSLQKPLQNGQRKKAIAALKDSVLTQKSAALSFNLANLYFETGKLNDAAKTYQSAIAQFPSFRRALRNLAFTQVRLDKTDDALESLTHAIKLGEQDANSYGLLGYLRLLRAEPASALNAYQQAILLEGERAEWTLGAVQALLQLDRAADALPWINQLLEQNPSRYDFYLIQADVLLALDRETDAAAALATVHHLGLLPTERQLLFGQLLLRQGSYQIAAEQLRISFEQLTSSDIPRAIETLRTALHFNEVELASELFAHLEAKFPADPSFKLTPQRTLLKAEIQLALGQKKEAIQLLTELSKAQPLMGRPLILLAGEIAADQPEMALLYLEQAARIDASAFDALTARTRLLVTLERYEEAIASLKSALKIRDDDALSGYLQALERLIPQD